jgi:hypothetical protein
VLLKVKAFIYRFSDVFGYRIYLAEKEESAYFYRISCIDNMCKMVDSSLSLGIALYLHRGIWHINNGFTTVYVSRDTNKIKSLMIKVKHAFRG